jgi:hypothetical protein
MEQLQPSETEATICGGILAESLARQSAGQAALTR